VVFLFFKTFRNNVHKQLILELKELSRYEILSYTCHNPKNHKDLDRWESFYISMKRKVPSKYLGREATSRKSFSECFGIIECGRMYLVGFQLV